MSDGDIPSASGDGSVLVTGTPRRQMSMKPPRQNSIIDEDEQVVIDAFTHRSMAQDLTSVKTMLLKLKRILQEVLVTRLLLLFVCYCGGFDGCCWQI